jgi:hypothetical protein
MYLGATAAMQWGAGSLHGRATIWKVDDFTIRAAAVTVVVVVVAAAVASAEQMPSSLC